MKILWATHKDKPVYAEVLITEVEERIPEASKWAIANGYINLRVADIDLSVKPDFTGTIN